jgi:NADH dehydrogenase
MSPEGGIVVVGSGLAGVWAAIAASGMREEAGRTERDTPITVVSPDDGLVIRPRLYEPQPQHMRVPLHGLFAPVGVRHVRAAVTGIAVDERRVDVRLPDDSAAGWRFDRLVLASGSCTRRPDVPGSDALFDVDTLAGAVRLDQHLRSLRGRSEAHTVVVVGAGFAGLELATALPSRLRDLAPGHQVRVVLVEAAPVIGPTLGSGPRPVIAQALEELGIEVITGRRLVAVSESAATLSDGIVIPTGTTVWTGGMTASPLTGCLVAERDDLGRLVVDRFLRVPAVHGVFAAGDTAAAATPDGHPVLQSCQHAIPLGKYAGRNAAADLFGRPLTAFDPGPYLTCLDLGDAGAVATSGWDREVRLVGERAKALKKAICESYIYPPAHDAGALHAMAARGPHPTVLP